MPDEDPRLTPEIRAFLEGIENIVTDPARLFDSDSARIGALHRIRKGNVQAWERAGPCLYRGCGARSIARSHTLQRAGPITGLLEDGHVLTPAFSKGRLQLKPVGASTASTFPGFCAEHEGVFHHFERKKVILQEDELDLQIFRTLCRELARKRHDVQQLEGLEADLKVRFARQVAAEAQRRGVTYESVTSDAGIFGTIASELRNLKRSLKALETLYAQHFPAVDGSGKTQLSGQAFQVNMAFPIALSGFCTFTATRAERRVLLGVIPQSTGTLIYMVGGPGDEPMIAGYFAAWGHYDLHMVDMVETWMIRGTDHWFLRPSVWAGIPEAQQAALLDGIMDTSKGMGDLVGPSIFSALRRTALAIPQKPDQTDDVRRYIETQRAKLA